MRLQANANRNNATFKYNITKRRNETVFANRNKATFKYNITKRRSETVFILLNLPTSFEHHHKDESSGILFCWNLTLLNIRFLRFRHKLTVYKLVRRLSIGKPKGTYGSATQGSLFTSVIYPLLYNDGHYFIFIVILSKLMSTVDFYWELKAPHKMGKNTLNTNIHRQLTKYIYEHSNTCTSALCKQQ
jgi:hypothetical protein